MSIRIDEEFRSLIPPLTAQELDQLESGLKRDGCLDALRVWGDVLIDGHNRFEICTRLDIAYKVEAISLPDRPSAKEWILRNQLGRRNLSDLDKIDVARQLEPFEREKAKERAEEGRSRGGNAAAGRSVENLPPSEKEKTRDHLAKLAQVSGKTYEAGVRVLTKGTPKLKAAVREKKISISKGAKFSRLDPNEQDAAVDREMSAKQRSPKESRAKEGSTISPHKKHKILVAIDELSEMINRPFSQVPIVHIRSKVAEVKSLIEKQFGIAEGE